MSDSETADDYDRVVAAYGDKLRVIRCKNDLQFIAQKRTGKGRAWPWVAFSYFATRKGAERLPDTELRGLAVDLFPK